MTRLAVVLVAVGLLAGAGCGDDADAGPTTTTAAASAAPAALPPVAPLDLEPIYGDALAELGLQLTSRGGLIDRSGGGYIASAKGTHLAMYVEPISERSVDEYLDGIAAVAAVFGDVFERWPGLASYDVCQEPVTGGPGDGLEPIPVTQIELLRHEAEGIDWATTSTVDLLRASRAEPPELQLRVSPRLAADPAYLALVEEADAG